MALEISADSKETSLAETMLDDARREDMEANKPAATKEEIVAMEKDAQAKRDEEEDMQYPHGPKLWIILSALCLAVFLVALDQTIIATAIPKITDHFNSIKDIGW